MSKENGLTHVVVRKLPVKLTAEEKAAMADSLAHKRIEIEPLKEKRKAINEEIRVLNDAILDLARAVEDGAQEREVDCAYEFDFAGNSKKLVRLDTGEDVEGPIGLTAEERNETLDFTSDPAAGDEQPPPTPDPPKPRGRRRKAAGAEA